MPMQMGWRWYGEDNDPITLSDIKQIRRYQHCLGSAPQNAR